MTDTHGGPAATPAAAPTRETGDGARPPEMIFLSGRPTLGHFIRRVRHRALVPPHRGELIKEWEAARGHIRSLEAADHGLADDPPILKPGPEYEPLLISLLKDPLVRHGFNSVPSEVAIVDLDTLVVHQQHIDLSFVRHLKRVIGPAPDRDEVFRVCLPYHHPAPPVEWSRAGRDTFVFMSPSNDLRILGTISLKPDQIVGHPPRGVLAAVVGIAVGFGGNFLNAVRAGNRIILNNGSHRAYALRDLGIRRVPCIVQHASTRDELEIVASRAVRANPAHYLEAPRPPLFKDYFDPRLRKVVGARPFLRQVTVRLGSGNIFVPAITTGARPADGRP